VLNAGDIHTSLGQCPGHNHRIPLCCKVMRSLMTQNDEIINEPPKGEGASLTIKYYRRTNE
jgi:hypothetical protein